MAKILEPEECVTFNANELCIDSNNTFLREDDLVALIDDCSDGTYKM